MLMPPNFELLAIERKGWRRWVFGRWVYSAEPFRRDVQRWAAKVDLKMMLAPHETLGPEYEAEKQKALAGGSEIAEGSGRVLEGEK